MATVAFDLVFDPNTNTTSSQNLTGFSVTTSGGVDPVNWSPGDWFGVAAWGAWPQSAGVPFALADDSVEGISGGAFPPDSQGIIDSRTFPTAAFLGATDTVNGDNPGPATATWTFDISAATDLAIAIDMAAMGDFEADGDFFTWTYHIDGGAEQSLFTSAVDEASSQTYLMEGGLAVVLDDPLQVNGTVLSDEFQTLTQAISGTGSTLTLTFTASTDGGSEAYAARNIVISGDASSSLVINEVIASHTGTDDTEFFELFGTPGTSLAGLSFIAIDASSGELEYRYDFAADDALGDNGFFLVGNPDGLFTNYGVTPDRTLVENSLQNNSATYALVETESLGGGIGTPVTGAEMVLDAVASTDPNGGTFFFDAPVIGPDGSFLPAGVRRVADGVDTDTAADFVIGNFFLSQDNTPTAAGGNIVIEDPTDLTIPEIQGSGLVSEVDGVLVRTTGIVTAVDTNGFYFQDAAGDGDSATSDGLFVFTGSVPTVTVGDEAEVVGRVLEFGGGSNLSLTEISLPTAVTVLSSGNALPEAVVLGEGGRPIPTESVAAGIEFYESLEGMRVTVADVVAVSPTDGDNVYGLANQGVNSESLSDRGTINNGPEDFNPERLRIQVDSGITPGFEMPAVNVGDGLGTVTGVVNYAGGEYEIEVTESFSAIAAGLTPETTTLVGDDDQLTVASYNVLNLDPTDPAEKFAALGAQIADALAAPDIIGLQEIQDNTGASDDGTVAADVTLQLLVEAIAAAGGPTYAFIDNTFIFDGLNGGEPGGNIRTAFLYNPDRVSLVEGSVQPGALQSQDDPASPFNGGRLPLAATFTFGPESVTVVNNHLSSKGGSVPLFGSVQPTDLGQEDPAINGSLNERRTQAQAVNDFVDTLLAADPEANIVVLGDMNEFEFISPLDILAGTQVSSADGFAIADSDTPAILHNLVETLPENERYSYIFQGNSQVLDHILVSDALRSGAELDFVHLNAEFIGTDATSDHDPVVARISFATDEPSPILGTPDADELVGTAAADLLDGLAGDDTVAGNLGQDQIFGGEGNDVLRGDRNSRNAQVGIGDDDFIDGGAGDDRIGGKGGNDTLLGGAGDDQIWGDDGDDILRGGLGNDILTGDDFSGGQGSDTFVLALGEGTDTIVDFEVGVDIIQVLGVSSFEALTLSGNDIAFGDEILATLQGVDTSTLTSSNFEFVA